MALLFLFKKVLSRKCVDLSCARLRFKRVLSKKALFGAFAVISKVVNGNKGQKTKKLSKWKEESKTVEKTTNIVENQQFYNHYDLFWLKIVSFSRFLS